MPVKRITQKWIGLMKTLTKHYWLSQSLWGTIIKTNDSVIYVPEVSLENRTTSWQEAKWLSEVTTLLISEGLQPWWVSIWWNIKTDSKSLIDVCWLISWNVRLMNKGWVYCIAVCSIWVWNMIYKSGKYS